jgi:hypothetical protein
MTFMTITVVIGHKGTKMCEKMIYLISNDNHQLTLGEADFARKYFVHRLIIMIPSVNTCVLLYRRLHLLT